MISTVPDASEMLTGIKGETPMILADSNDKLNFNRFDDQRKADPNSEVDTESVAFEARNITKVSPSLNVTPGPSNSIKDIDLVRHLPSKKQSKICSTNEKRGRPIRSFNRVVSPKCKKLSPKLSPKAKIALKLSQNRDKMKSKDKIEDKNASQTIKPRKVLEIVSKFESSITVNKDDIEVKKNVRKGDTKDAFEALMQGRSRGDTQLRTPVRKKVKRLESIASNSNILNCVKKSARKGGEQLKKIVHF